MATNSKLPELRRDSISTLTNVAAFAIVGLFFAGLWMLVR